MTDWRPGATREILRERARLNAEIRTFFSARGVLEVETPLLCSSTATDLHLASFLVLENRGPCDCFPEKDNTVPPLYLQTSPEFAMKRLLAAGSGPIFQLGKAFRAGDLGTRHNPEFTLLEWYRPGYSLAQLMDEVEALLGLTLYPSVPADVSAAGQSNPVTGIQPVVCERVSYRALFEAALGVNPHGLDIDTLRRLVVSHTSFGDGGLLDSAACLDLLFATCIEPSLGQERPVFVCDFPLQQASLAQVISNADGDRVAARCEVYVHGMELANAYQELTDATEQRRRFDADNAARRARGLPEIPVDGRFVAALAAGLPDCAGVALGVDRLLLLRTGAASLDNVLTFASPRA